MRISKHERNKTESHSNQRDMLDDNIQNQMNAPTQEMVNDDSELIYIYAMNTI